METKFTPAPWKIGKGSFIITEHKTENTLGNNSVDFDYYEGYLICETVHEKNATLIETAPDLFAILSEALDEELSYESGERVYGKWIEKAKHVLAKARGEEVE